MRYKKNKFIIFYVFNIILLFVILLLAIPASKFLNRINLDDNEFVTGQVVINPKAESPKVIDRTMKIKFVAEVDSLLEWDFKALQDTIEINVGENRVISYEGKNLSDRVITFLMSKSEYWNGLFIVVTLLNSFQYSRKHLLMRFWAYVIYCYIG